MIHPALPPACYTQQYWFDLEREKLFNRYWLLAGLTQQLRADNSFITRTLAGIPVLIQNCGGTLRAFRNACPHRACPIQIEPFGNRKLLCPYHGWRFGHDGALRGIPNGTGYNFSDTDKAGMNLQPYALATVGNFVFVNLAENPAPIAGQLPGDLIGLIEEISPWFATEVSYTTFTGNYNWKLNFENVAEGEEGQHIPFVHKNTFASAFRVEGIPCPPSHLFRADGPLAHVRLGGETPLWQAGHAGLRRRIDVRETSNIWRPRAGLPYKPRWFSTLLDSCDRGGFFACTLFPNVNFGGIHGEHFYVQQFVPLAPDRTEYHSWIFHARLKDGVPPMPHLLWGIHHAEKRVVDEDILVFEQIQKALAARPETTGALGDNERSVAAFGRHYLQCLTEGETSHE